MTAEELIADLAMTPIPEEGAWFAPGPRTRDLSAITLLLTGGPDGFSALHRLAVDEGWQWLAGAPAALLRLAPDGGGDQTILDEDHSQALVPSGTWQGGATRGDWTLLACWCAPAFEPQHFVLGDRAGLTAAYPGFAGEVAALTREQR